MSQVGRSVGDMGRRHRQDHPGALHFVTNRGTAQTMVFRSDHDHRFFLALLGELEIRFGVQVIAYVLMGNHYHLILRSCDGRLAEAMQFLDGSHARRFNAKHERKGALWQARYDARAITDDAHFEQAGLYLHRNPERAGLVERAVQHRWSSLGAYGAGRSALRWLHLDPLAGRSGPEYLEAVAAKFEGGGGKITDPSLRRFTAEVEAAFRASDQAVATALSVSIDEFYVVVRGRANVPRMAAIAHAAKTTGLPLSEIAQRYGLRTADSVQSSIRRLRERSACDPALAAHLHRLGLERRLAG